MIAPYMLDVNERLWERSGIMTAYMLYDGPLGVKSRPDELIRLRGVFHRQLKRLWSEEEALKDLALELHIEYDGEFIGSVIPMDKLWGAKPVGFARDPVVHRYEERDAAIWYLAHNRPSERRRNWHQVAYSSPVMVPDPANPKEFFTIGQAEADKILIYTGEEYIARKNTVKDCPFIPIVTKELDLMCYLKIEFARHDPPGSLFARSGKNSGDLDNRLKVLFDSLRVPSEDQIRKGYRLPSDKNPCYCLMADDSLISGIEITTRQKLDPPTDSNDEKSIHMRIEAIIRPTRVTGANRDFLGGWLK